MAALLAIALPVVLAIHLAGRQARELQTGRLVAWATSALDRSDAATAQMRAAMEELLKANSADPCAPANLARMRRHAIASEYLKAVGYVRDSRLVCSSLGSEGEGFELGPVAPEWVTPFGTHMRVDVRFPFDPEHGYLVGESGGYATLISKDLTLDFITELDAGAAGRDVALASFATFNGRFLVRRGEVDAAWVPPASNRLPVARDVRTFVHGGHLVAVAVSNHYYVGTIAALPMSDVTAQARSTAAILLPVALLAGGLLAAAMVYWRRQQVAMPAVMRLALKRNEFSLRYQPVVNLRTGHWIGAEALLRWRRPNGQWIPPDLFIPAAENVGMIQALTGRVLELAARDLKGAVASHPDLHIAINISSKDLESTTCATGGLRNLVARTGLKPRNLLVEISERGILESERTRAVLDEIREAGFRVAIDDFGTGYSNLAHLANFKLDYLKIDKLFVDTMRGDGATSSVVPHIIEMARSLDLRVIAEGVETEEQAQFLRELGVQSAQGWLFGKPMKIDELLRGYDLSRAASA